MRPNGRLRGASRLIEGRYIDSSSGHQEIFDNPATAGFFIGCVIRCVVLNFVCTRQQPNTTLPA